MKLPRIPLISSLSFLLLVTLIVLWCRSGRRSEVVRFCDRSGNWHGFASDRKGMLFVTSDLPGGPEMAFTADAASVDAADFAELHDAFLNTTTEKWKFLGFRFAKGSNTDWQCTFKAVLVPYWALMLPLAVLPFRTFRRVLTRFLRHRRGQCLACGYDLRHSPERCPECGLLVPLVSRATITKRPSTRIRFGRGAVIVSIGVLLGSVWSATKALHVSPGRRNDPLSNRIPEIDLSGLSVSEAFTKIKSAIGSPIQFGPLPYDLSLADLRPKRLSRLRLWEVKPEAAIQATLDEACSQWPANCRGWMSDDGRVVFARADNEPMRACSYPIGDLVNSFVPNNNGSTPDSRHRFAAELRSTIAGILYRWPIQGGQVAIAGDRLVVRNTRAGQEFAREVLVALRRADAEANGPVDSERESTHANPALIVREFNPKPPTLEGAINTLRDAAQVNIVVKWDDVSVAGVDRDAPVTGHFSNITVDQALRGILNEAMAGHSYGLSYEVRGDAIYIFSGNYNAYDTNSYIVPLSLVGVYDVRDIQSRILEHHRSAPKSGDSSHVSWYLGGAPTTNSEAMQQLIVFIRSHDDAEQWNDGDAQALEGRLIFTRSRQSHLKIAALLKAVRIEGSKDQMELFELQH